MKRRKWDSKTKATLILEGLKGKPVAAISQEYQISQAQYYQWRDQFLSGNKPTPSVLGHATLLREESPWSSKIPTVILLSGENI